MAISSINQIKPTNQNRDSSAKDFRLKMESFMTVPGQINPEKAMVFVTYQMEADIKEIGKKIKLMAGAGSFILTAMCK